MNPASCPHFLIQNLNNMLLKLWPALLFCTLSYTACKKTDQPLIVNEDSTTIDETELERRYSSSGCDYVEASSKVVSFDGTQVEPLFKKFYDRHGKLYRIRLNFLDPQASGFQHFYLNVSHAYRKMIFTRNDGDTALILNFDRHGRLTGSKNWYGFLYGADEGINEDAHYLREFVYQHGRLKQINFGEVFFVNSEDPPAHYDTTWSVETIIDYDWKKNPSHINFPGQENEPPLYDFFYTYDLKRKAKAQFYADERLPRFFYLLKYLNLFPELNPDNILLSLIMITSQYPGDQLNTYNSHRFDRSGRLISYAKEGSIWAPEKWFIEWRCNLRDHRH